MFFVLQSLEQLKAVYKDNWETFLANSGLKIFFNLEDHFSRDYVSKLIGETEIVREVRSASDSMSESDSVSRSTTRSQSQTQGKSVSIGTSETEGTNSSDSRGHSWGKSRSVGWNWGRSESRNWTPGLLFDSYRPGGTKSQSSGESVTKSKSEGWNTSHSEGVSHSASRSRTNGTSENWTTGTSETEGITHGTSQSWTKGMSETIQKRALITPDEIGQIFARIDERAQPAYPGLALVVISGARPVTIRRVNYFEDFQFMNLFDPHPDYPFEGPKELTVDGRRLSDVLQWFFRPEGIGMRISEWRLAVGQAVVAGQEVATILLGGQKVGYIRVPHDGIISSVAMNGLTSPVCLLFTMKYYDDGVVSIEPFAELMEFAIKLRDRLLQEYRALEKSSKKLAVVMGIIILVAVIIAGQVGELMVAVTAFAGVGITIALEMPKAKEMKKLKELLKKYGVEVNPS